MHEVLDDVPGLGVDRDPQHVDPVTGDAIADADQPILVVERNDRNVVVDEDLHGVEVAVALGLRSRRARLIVEQRLEALRAVKRVIVAAFDRLHAAQVERLFGIAASDPRLADDRGLAVA